MPCLRAVVTLLLMVSSTGCYSRTIEREVRVAVPRSCVSAVWVPPTPSSSGYWRCA